MLVSTWILVWKTRWEFYQNAHRFISTISCCKKASVLFVKWKKIETDFYAAYEIAWAYLDSRFSSNQTVNKVGNLDQIHTSESIPRTVNCISPHPSGQAIQTKIHTRIKPGCEPVEHSTTKHCDTAEQYRPQNNDNRKSPNQNIAHCLTDSCATPSIGHDLWMQLERVKIPIFSGDKRNYPRWKAAFQACIDNAPVTPEYKMLQLRQYVSGEALKVIENLGHSSFAYEAAKDRLERKYGGKRRKVAIFLEDLERFKQIRSDSAEELEQFADLLDLAVINLKEAGEHQDLGDGSMYLQLQRKLPQSLLARYHGWVFENDVTASVIALKTWVTEESRFQTIASETVHGLTSRAGSNLSTPSTPNSAEQRTFFINQRISHPLLIQSCQLCKEQHRIWECQAFLHKEVSERWNIAKRFQLCYRCLAEGHEGKSCRKTRRCGKDGCHKKHHRLLHVTTCMSEVSEQKMRSHTEQSQERLGPVSTCSDRLTFETEGNRITEHGNYFASTYLTGGHMNSYYMSHDSSSEQRDNLTQNPRPGITIDGQTLSKIGRGQLKWETPRPKRRSFDMEGEVVLAN